MNIDNIKYDLKCLAAEIEEALLNISGDLPPVVTDRRRSLAVTWRLQQAALYCKYIKEEIEKGNDNE